jgi:hypothetical protein
MIHVLDIRPGDVAELFKITLRQSHRTQTMVGTARGVLFASF